MEGETPSITHRYLRLISIKSHVAVSLFFLQKSKSFQAYDVLQEIQPMQNVTIRVYPPPDANESEEYHLIKTGSDDGHSTYLTNPNENDYRRTIRPQRSKSREFGIKGELGTEISSQEVNTGRNLRTEPVSVPSRSNTEVQNIDPPDDSDSDGSVKDNDDEYE